MPDLHGGRGCQPPGSAEGPERGHRRPDVTPDRSSWQHPRNSRSWPVIDGAVAAKWEQVRQRRNALQQVHDNWLATSWKIALGMRMGRNFGEVTADIMADIAALQEAVLASPKNATGRGAQEKPPQQRQRHQRRGPCGEASEEGRQKGKGKGKGRKGDNQDQWWKKNQWQFFWGIYRQQ